MVGDRLDNDIAPAKAIGMPTVRVRQGLAAVQQSHDPALTPDLTIDSLTRLPEVLG